MEEKIAGEALECLLLKLKDVDLIKLRWGISGVFIDRISMAYHLNSRIMVFGWSEA